MFDFVHTKKAVSTKYNKMKLGLLLNHLNNPLLIFEYLEFGLLLTGFTKDYPKEALIKMHGFVDKIVLSLLVKTYTSDVVLHLHLIAFILLIYMIFPQWQMGWGDTRSCCGQE